MSSTLLPFLLLAPTLQRLRVLCNLGMASPWLAAAVTAQVLMGYLFVYNAKFTTDLNLFYSLGDNGVFLTMQVWCKTAHAIGACLSSFLGPLMYSEAGKPSTKRGYHHHSHEVGIFGRHAQIKSQFGSNVELVGQGTWKSVVDAELSSQITSS